MRTSRFRPVLRSLPSLLMGCAIALPVFGQEVADVLPEATTSGALYDELAEMDDRLFAAGFVNCDAEAVVALVTEDVEFYHDQTGFRSGSEVREDFRRLAESCPRDQGIRRQLVAGTLAVYPIHDYGAVQMGIHRFVPSDGTPGSIARFVHLWQSTGGAWKLARVLSFDHRPFDGEIPRPR